jgi:hypothetical protein
MMNSIKEKGWYWNVADKAGPDAKWSRRPTPEFQTLHSARPIKIKPAIFLAPAVNNLLGDTSLTTGKLGRLPLAHRHLNLPQYWPDGNFFLSPYVIAVIGQVSIRSRRFVS